jgi:hypothetical protein
MVNVDTFSRSVAAYILRKLDRFVDMDNLFREELTVKAIAHARDEAGLCKGRTSAGSFCSRGTKDKSGFCFQHARGKNQRIKQSTACFPHGAQEEEMPTKKRERKEKKTEKKHKKNKKSKKTKRSKEEEELESTDEVEKTPIRKRHAAIRANKFCTEEQIVLQSGFTSSKDKRRYFEMLKHVNELDGLYMGLFFPLSEPTFPLNAGIKDNAALMLRELKDKANIILDNMEEEGQCLSDDVKSMRTAIKTKWNEVFGEQTKKIDTKQWRKVRF